MQNGRRIVMLRDIVVIDEDKCNGCGLCIPNCHEGALQIIDGKARLVSDLMCDGLGACLGHCPEGAMVIEKREAEPYDERKVMELMIQKGENTIVAHLAHLKDHGEYEFLKTALEVLKEKEIEVDMNKLENPQHNHTGCPGSRMMDMRDSNNNNVQDVTTGTRKSALKQWPVQLHLVPPTAPYFQNADLLLAADCVAHAVGDFHKDYLQGKALAIACPKLDQGLESYIEKVTVMVDQAKLNTITVMMMEVPCCGGLLQLARKAVESASRKIPIKSLVVGIDGGIRSEEWV
jgi:NAD-dependent dihydropyrimidine dehydrogenase PreA subunit